MFGCYYPITDIWFNNLNEPFMSLQIGFATEFYTLWDVYVEKVYSGPHHIADRWHCIYQQNVSTDIEKVKAKYPGIPINEDLRGCSRSFTRVEYVQPGIECLSFGFYSGRPIMELEHTEKSAWQLKRAAGFIPGEGQESNPRRRVLARRRLIQWGELVRYPHFEKRFTHNELNPDETIDVRVNYATPRFVQREIEKKEAAARPHYFTNGERIHVSVKQSDFFGFDTQFGRCYIQTFVTDDGKVLKYMGSSPQWNITPDEFKSIKATVKHSEYKGNRETHLQRIKLV